MLDLSQVKALSFDCYGTLIDWEAGLKDILNPWAAAFGLPQRDEALLESFGRHEAAVEAAQPAWLYRDILREVLRRIGREFGAPTPDEWSERLANSVGEWPPFPDTAESLLRLKERFKLCILSNVDHFSFARTLPKLKAEFDLIVTAEDVGSYKPSPRNFQALLDRLGGLGVAPDELLHVAQSLYHDHAPAKRLGLKTAWIDRRRGLAGSGATLVPTGTPAYDASFPSMRDFADWAWG
jgi:2-haloacid dehalogenase